MDKDGGGDWEKKKKKHITVVTIEIDSLSPNLSSLVPSLSNLLTLFSCLSFTDIVMISSRHDH